MSPYEISLEVRRLMKLSGLKKEVSADTLVAKDSQGPVGLSGIRSIKDDIPEPIANVMRIRARLPIPAEVLHRAMDEGIPSLVSHFTRHRIMMSPGESLYTAMGRKNPDLFESIKNITLGEILSLAQNKAAVASTCALPPMRLDHFDEPRHIRIIAATRGMSPDILSKQAKDNGLAGNLQAYQFEFASGVEDTQSKDFVKHNSGVIQDMIDDGTIIKVVQLMSTGRQKTIFEKTASFSDEDALFAIFIASS